MGHWGRPYTNDQGVTQLDHYPTPTWCQDPEQYIRDHNTPPDMTVTLHQPTGCQGCQGCKETQPNQGGGQ